MMPTDDQVLLSFAVSSPFEVQNRLVGGLAIGDVGQRHHRLLVGVDDLALPVRQPLRDARREIGVQVLRIDLHMTVGRVELLALHGFADRDRRDLGRLLHRLLPQEDLEVGRFQRVMGHRLRVLHEGAVALDEGLVEVGVDRLEVRERGVAADRIFGAHRRDLDLRGHGRADRQLVVGEALVLVLAIERDDGVADHVRQHDVAARALDLVDHRAPFGMAELEIFVGDPFAAVLLDQDLGDLRHLARIDVVRSDDEELLLAERLDDPGNEVRKLLVGNGAGVDDVLASTRSLRNRSGRNRDCCASRTPAAPPCGSPRCRSRTRSARDPE